MRTYEIEMYNAFGIVEGSEVRVAGVNAGVVETLDITPEKRAVVTVELDTSIGELGDETTCSSEPQSLIAEYFIDCDPAGAPLPDGGGIPAERVSQTVQPDLVQNTLREPFKQRFRLLINEFGTALAGNPEALNEAIRLGAPALTQLQGVSEILADQRNLIRKLNTDSDVIIGELARQRRGVVRFIDEAEDISALSASRREDLSRNFEILDDFLAEFKPTLVELGAMAREQEPLLTDLRAAGPGLGKLTAALPAFNRASEDSFTTLGDAAVVGDRALTRGRDEIDLLRQAGLKAPYTSEVLADLLSDLDDPRRAVEINDLVAGAAGRTSVEPGRRDTMGYTGFEGLLNYAYYQALSINQFDKASHLLHFGLYEANTGPCGAFHSGHNTATGDPGVPAEGGGTTTDVTEAIGCVGWLGPNQPGINEDLNLPKYHPSVCPNGTAPERARIELCDPNDPASAQQRATARSTAGKAGNDDKHEGGEDQAPGAGQGPLPPLDDLPGGANADDLLEDVLGLGGREGRGGSLDLSDRDRGDRRGRGGRGGRGSDDQAAEMLLDFLLGN